MKYKYGKYTIGAEYRGEKLSPWGSSHHHVVTVSNRESRKRTSFDFWASDRHPELRSRYDAMNAFYCFITDAISADQDFEDFCCEFGYDSDSIKALKIYKACELANKKARRVIDEDLYEFANRLQEIAA